MTPLEFPFLDLFEGLRQAGMPLSPEQYDLLRQALRQGFGLQNWRGDGKPETDWDDLRQVCRVLWVKPSSQYDAQVFEDTFNRYVRDKQREVRSHQPATAPPAEAKPPRRPPKRQLPRIPPRKMPDSQPPPEPQKAPIAVKTWKPDLPEVPTTGLCLNPRTFPLSSQTVLDGWRLLRRPQREGTRWELDLEATIHCITQEGYFSDVVMRPVLSKRAELVVLVDDSNVMLPYRPALEPLVAAVEQRQICPANLYRFTVYPGDYLYDWQQPTRAVALDRVLSHMHPRRTIVVVWSEAGATQLVPAPDHRRGLMAFATRLHPCIRTLLWLNPVPRWRWRGTLAEEMARGLQGRMVHPDRAAWLALAKQPDPP